MHETRIQHIYEEQLTVELSRRTLQRYAGSSDWPVRMFCHSSGCFYAVLQSISVGRIHSDSKDELDVFVLQMSTPVLL